MFLKTILSQVILLGLIVTVSGFYTAQAAHDHSGFIHLGLYTIDSSCIIPDHNGGKWGCSENSVMLWHTADYASEIVITNHSVSGGPSIIVRDLTTDQMTSIVFVDERDGEHIGLPIVAGENRVEFSIYENQRLVAKQTHHINVVQSNRY